MDWSPGEGVEGQQSLVLLGGGASTTDWNPGKKKAGRWTRGRRTDKDCYPSDMVGGVAAKRAMGLLRLFRGGGGERRDGSR